MRNIGMDWPSASFVAVALFLAMAPATARAQGGVVGAVVVLPEHYAAFDPTDPTREGARATVDLHALVMHGAPRGEQRLVIILNPEHATPETLYAAIIAGRSSHRPASSKSVITITAPAANVPPGIRKKMESLIAELQKTPLEPLEALACMGRRVIVRDVWKL